MEYSERIRLNGQLRQVFTPNKPIKTEDIFAGRLREITRLLDAIEQDGQHALIYGERGVGKTSLVNAFSFVRYSHREPAKVLRTSARPQSTFYSIWNDIFRMEQMPDGIADGVADEDEQPSLFETRRNRSYADTIPTDAGPSDVIDVLRTFPQREYAIIFDEFDRIEDESVTETFADLIKQLSDDGSLKITIVLVGVAENIDALIVGHASIERCTKQVQVKRMPINDLEEIVKKGFAKVGMEYQERVPNIIGRLSHGFPKYTHELALNAGFVALAADTKIVSSDHVKKAIDDAIEDADATILNAYAIAIRSAQRDNLYEQILIACSLAEPDDLGYFAPADVLEPLEEIVGRSYRYQTFAPHLSKFCTEERGSILERIQVGSTQRWRYRFKNPLMRPYVLFRGIKEFYVPSSHSPF